jgi:hypothetical protein
MVEGRHGKPDACRFSPFLCVSSNFLPTLGHSRGRHGGGILTVILKVSAKGLRGSGGSCRLAVGRNCNLA